MAYLTDEISVHDGEPVELYEFVGPLVSYLYTSWDEPVVHATKTYTPVPMKRTAVMGGPHGDIPEMQIEMPYDAQLVLDNAYQVAPIGLHLTIHRLHTVTGDSIIYWDGEVMDVFVKGRVATINVPSVLGGAMSSQVPSVFYQGQCNHVLYDSRCALARATYKTSATVFSVVDEVTIQVSTVGGLPDNTFRAGEIVIPSLVDRRLILRQVGTLLTINYPFRAIQGGDSLELYQGCLHVPEVCRDKFSNIANFGGHPFIPDHNVFETGVK